MADRRRRRTGKRGEGEGGTLSSGGTQVFSESLFVFVYFDVICGLLRPPLHPVLSCPVKVTCKVTCYLCLYLAGLAAVYAPGGHA